MDMTIDDLPVSSGDALYYWRNGEVCKCLVDRLEVRGYNIEIVTTRAYRYNLEDLGVTCYQSAHACKEANYVD